ncbi:MAG: purine-binding chemotaxis protein CheW [Verrucomicrobia bacterium]|jgi:chemotaxis-related protein WspD|nr:purine-binding chemotaxis protein CheW [Verrucomicrobiota bacterium]
MSAPAINDCWKRIGIWGDRSCAELKTYLHCRNCPVYSAGAARLLDAEVPETYLSGHARHYAEAKQEVRHRAHSVVIIRVASEWFALATTVFREVAPLRPVHSLPHRRDRIVTGLVNIRGELLICISLAATLGLTAEAGRERTARLAVVSREGDRFVFVADEVAGLHRYDDAELSPVPATLAHAQAAYTRGILSWQNRPVGVIDDQLLFYTLNRNLA